MEEVISINNFNKFLDHKQILKDVNLLIKKGDVVGLIGPSGQGKSVLIKSIIGFYASSPKNIQINREKIGFSMQNNSVYENLTVKQNLNYFGKLYGISKRNKKERILSIISQLNLNNFEKVLVKNLSGGTQKRVDIACALIQDPEILILDEPFLGLDPQLINMLSNFFISLNKRGKTIIISSHRLSEISLFCSKFILVKNQTVKEIQKNQIMEAYK